MIISGKKFNRHRSSGYLSNRMGSSYSVADFFHKNVTVLSMIQASLYLWGYAATWKAHPRFLFSPPAGIPAWVYGSVNVDTSPRILHFESGIRGWHGESLLYEPRKPGSILRLDLWKRMH